MHMNLETVFNKCYKLDENFAIILANGLFPENDYCHALFKKASHIICCDGAISSLEKIKTEPTYIIGDGDSLSNDLKLKYQEKIKIIVDQYKNDLTKAVNFAIDCMGLDNIIILGFNGLREDHILGNISLLVEYSKKTNSIIMLSDYGFFSVHNKNDRIATISGQQISLFAIDPNTKVTTHGLKWDLDNYLLNSWYKGTLNEALNDSFSIETNHPILIYHSFEIKHPLFTHEN